MIFVFTDDEGLEVMRLISLPLLAKEYRSR